MGSYDRRTDTGILTRAVGSLPRPSTLQAAEDFRQAFDAGAERVSIDFTEGRLATRADPRNPWTGAGKLPYFIKLNNRFINRFSAEERAKIGVHTRPGGDRDSVHGTDVPYNLLPELFKLNAGYFLIQFASEREKDPVLEMIGKHSRDDADGVPQVCYIGVTVTQSPRVEGAQEICDLLVRAADFIRRSGSARPTIAASPRSRSTRSRITARRTTPATLRSK